MSESIPVLSCRRNRQLGLDLKLLLLLPVHMYLAGPNLTWGQGTAESEEIQTVVVMLMTDNGAGHAASPRLKHLCFDRNDSTADMLLSLGFSVQSYTTPLRNRDIRRIQV